MKSYQLRYQKETDSYTLDELTSTEESNQYYEYLAKELASNIPAGVIMQMIQRLISSLEAYELEGKNKAYGNNE